MLFEEESRPMVEFLSAYTMERGSCYQIGTGSYASCFDDRYVMISVRDIFFCNFTDSVRTSLHIFQEVADFCYLFPWDSVNVIFSERKYKYFLP